MKEKIARLLTPVVFLSIIFTVAICNSITPDKGFSESENRFLEKSPEFSIAKLFDGSFTMDYEEYITDQFILRDELIKIKTQSEAMLLKSDTKGIYFGDAGYLFEQYDNTNVDTDLLYKNLSRISEFANTTASTLGEDKVRVMPIPTAMQVLSDKLPANAPAFDQLGAFKRLDIGDMYVDAYAMLSSHRDEDIYYKTDHHWTALGAYYGYVAYMESIDREPISLDRFEIATMSDEFYGTLYTKAPLMTLKPDTMQKFALPDRKYTVDYNMGEKTTDTLYDESYLAKRDKYSYYLGGNNAITVIKSDNEKQEKLLVVKDSFAHSLVPFLVNEFSEVHSIDLRYYNGSMQEYIIQNEITDVLVLYNFASLQSETKILNISK